MLEDLVSGKLNGKIIWVCDFRYLNFDNKPIRKLPPTKVLVVDKSETDKIIYYSQTYLVPFNKNGKLSKSKIIKVFDNTGYRSNTGTPLNCFDNEQDCLDYYKYQVTTVMNDLLKYINTINEKLSGKMLEYGKLIDTNFSLLPYKNNINELMLKFRDEELTEYKEPYSSDAEIWSGMESFMLWVDENNKK